jgi:hypothetical protein
MEKKTSEAQLKAVKNYKKKVNRITIDFAPTEIELWEHVQSQPKKQTYIKDLIRTDLRNEDYAEIDEFCKKKGWSKAEFIREAYDQLRIIEHRRRTSVYYTHSPESDVAHIIVCIDNTAADFSEQLIKIEFCDSAEDRETGLVAMLTRWRDVGTLDDTFYKLPTSDKYPASEILTRFPDAKELK